MIKFDIVELTLADVQPHSQARDVIDYVRRRIDLGFAPPSGDSDHWMAPLHVTMQERLSHGWRLGKVTFTPAGTEYRATLRFWRCRLGRWQ